MEILPQYLCPACFLFLSTSIYLLATRHSDTNSPLSLNEREWLPSPDRLLLILFNVLSKLDPPNCGVGLSMLSIPELWGRSPPDQSNGCLKGHFNFDIDSIRGEQSGSKANKSVCQNCKKSVESCLRLIALSTTLKFYPRKEKNLWTFLRKWLAALVCNRCQS